MLNNQKFYWSTIRNAVIAFGTLFSNIYVDRRDSENTVVQTLKIPLTYGPKSKAIARVMAQPNLEDRPFKIAIPSITFQITGLEYNPSRKLPVLNQARAPLSPTSDKTLYSSAPYDMTIQLSIIAKNQNDALQIVEQILPYFNPVYTVSLKDIPELNIVRDVPVTLVNINYNDNYAGPVEENRVIEWDITFNLKLNFYGPISTTGVIKIATVNTHISEDTSVSAGEMYRVSVNPITAEETDNWTWLEEFDIQY